MNTKRKVIYIVRHGESHSNTGNIRGNRNAKLTRNGLKQSTNLAYKLKYLNADAVFSSELQRARETAEIISSVCKLPVIYSDLLNERRLPSEIVGKNKDDPLVKEIDRKIRSNFSLNNLYYSDEENFEDLKRRSLQIIDLIENHESEISILVTHGILARIITACAIFGKEIKGYECEMFIRGFRMEKTGVSSLTFNENLNEEGAATRWQLWVWNDHNHLSEYNV